MMVLVAAYSQGVIEKFKDGSDPIRFPNTDCD